MIRTPDQRLRVFVSSTLGELAPERQAARAAIEGLHLTPIMFELGARPHPPQNLYRAYLEQSHVFIGIYWERYGWIGPGMEISGLEDEYLRSASKPRLIYVKSPAPGREARLEGMLDGLRSTGAVSYKQFTTVDELRELVANDLALLLTERFEAKADLPAPVAESEAAAPDHEQAARALGNLPLPPTPLIGREPEMEAATSLLDGDATLVSLVGPGGSGKTRLALEIAHRLRGEFRDGVFLVKLEAITDPGLVIPTIACTLSLCESALGPSLPDLVRRHLAERHLLVLLDNLEQVIGASRAIADLLQVCSATRFLVTSRTPLRIQAERVVSVLPFDVPPPAAESDLEELGHMPAVRLFVDRARAIRPDFMMSDANAGAIADICRRLDGLPLAIELAAARTRVFSPSQLLARLEHRFDALTRGSADAPERHSTLERTIDWSYALLSGEEREFFRRLSVFSGGFTLEAAVAVCEWKVGDVTAALSICETLVDNSLLQPPDSSDETGRLRMLETIREFAHDRLAECGEADEQHARHGRYFLSLVDPPETDRLALKSREWHAWAEGETDNMRAAMTWGLVSDDRELTLRIATATWLFWWKQGYWHEGLHWLERGLEDAAGLSPSIRALALVRAGWLRHQLSDNDRAIVLFKESIRLSRESGDRAITALALSNLGATLMSQAAYGEAVSTLEEALAMRRELGAVVGVYSTLLNLGAAEAEQGHDDRAAALFTESLSLAGEAGDEDHVCLVLLNLAELHIHRGEFGRAEECHAQAEPISQRQNNRIVAGYIARGRGLTRLRQGDLPEAMTLLRETTLEFEEIGDTEYVLMNLEALAAIAGQEGKWTRAAVLLGAAEALRETYRVTRQPRYEDEFQVNLSAARDVLGEAGFGAAVARGRALTLSDAVRSAVEE